LMESIIDSTSVMPMLNHPERKRRITTEN